MKKLWIVTLIILFVFSFAMAQEIHWANQATIEWDAVTEIDGQPIPPEDYIAYRVWQRVGEIENEVDETTATIYIFTFIEEGIYTVGVQAVRYHTNGDPEQVSIVNWSDVNGIYTPNPFVFGFYKGPDAPLNLRVQ